MGYFFAVFAILEIKIEKCLKHRNTQTHTPSPIRAMAQSCPRTCAQAEKQEPKPQPPGPTLREEEANLKRKLVFKTDITDGQYGRTS